MTARETLDAVYRVFSRKPAYHTLFWVVLYALLVLFGHLEGMNWAQTLQLEFISLAFYAVVVYINLLYLVPQLLARNSLLYLLSLLLLSALVTPLKVLFQYIYLQENPSWQLELVEGQWIIFLGNVLVGLLSTVLKVVIDWVRYQREKQELTTRTMQSELRFLRSQINPHFLFNTLNNLYALTLIKSDIAPDIVLKLAEIMRYMLYECNEKHVLLSKEIQYMQNYLDLERLRQPRAADISLTVEGDVSDQMVAPLMFVPFLENSFKHGLNHDLQGNGYVRAQLKVQQRVLEFTIENSKAGQFPRHHHVKSGGIGLTNIKHRLDLLYPKQHALTILDEPNKFTVHLSLPIE